jgi:NAD(P)-dependent dehydrogenase (short-subunit alcohol dehydrogenase family)
MELGLRGRVILITGATANIGAATAVAFGREGASVALTYRHNEQAAHEVASKVEAAGGEATVLPFDLTDPGDAERLVADVVDRWDRLDALVNNAVRWPGGFPGPMDEMFDEIPDWETDVAANLFGHMRVIHAALPVLRRSSAGRIATISTSMLERGIAGGVLYTAAKGGLHGFNRSLAWELKDEVLTNIVMPGWTVDGATLPDPLPEDLRMVIENHCRQTPTGQLVAADHVADTIAFLCSPLNGSITGEVVKVTGGYI